MTSSDGSPPLARGPLGFDAHEAVQDRLTPARAGTTQVWP